MNDLERRLAALSPEQRELLTQRLKLKGALAPTTDQPTNGSDQLIGPAERRGALPLSFAQQRLWLLHQLEPTSAAYHGRWLFHLTGALDQAALVNSLTMLVQRHETLRTSFPVRAREPEQEIAPDVALPWSVSDLQQHPAETRLAAGQRIINQAAQQPFDLKRPPLFRIQLVRLSQTEHLLGFTFHHIICDEWSLNVFFRELKTLYAGFISNRPIDLPPPRIQYADVAVWQRGQLQDQHIAEQLRYWVEQLGDDVPLLNLPTDFPRPPVQTFRGARTTFALSDELSAAVIALSRRQGVTLFMTLLAAFQVLLQRYTGQDQIVVGISIANRLRSELEHVIGPLFNTLALKTNLDGRPSFLDVLARVRDVALGAYAHQDVPFERLVEELQPTRDPSHNPLYQVLFDVRSGSTAGLTLPGLTIEALDRDEQSTQLDLLLAMTEAHGSLGGELIYNLDLFKPATIARLLTHFETLLGGIVTDPARPVATIPLLSAAEQAELVVGRNQSGVPTAPPSCLHQLIEQQAARTPEACAVVFGQQTLSYAELNARANQLAHVLQRQGVAADVCVGVCLERSLELPVAVLAVLKAGGAFVPLDPAYPAERLQFMLRNTQVPVLITQQHLRGSLPEHAASVICLDSDWPTITQAATHNPVSAVSPDNLAYVIHTSGSTGQPKGVLVPHRGLPNLAAAQIAAFGVRPDSRVLQWASFSFDAAVAELCVALVAGATLVLAPADVLVPGPQLLRLLDEQQITVVTLVPSALAALPVPEQDDLLPALETLIVAGEACPADLLARWSGAGGRRRLVNAYGPTETTVCATVAVDLDPAQVPPLGRPLPHVQVYVLDAQMQPVPLGVAGELYVGGAGVARGYLNRPALTAEKFVPDPFSPIAGARLYRTGDLVRQLSDPNANLSFVGRSDDQVKVRGFRIELGEIEAALMQHPAIREAVVLARVIGADDQRLVAYLVGAEAGAQSSALAAPAELRAFLQLRLPEYMIPNSFVVLPALPLTPHGKADRQALPLIEAKAISAEAEQDAPRTPIEAVLADIWADILQIDQVGIHENFFDLGGHSLLATQIMLRVQEIFQIDMALSVPFEAPTVAQMTARLLAEQHTGEQPATVSIPPMGHDVQPRLSFAQERLWFVDQFAPGGANYNIALVQRLRGPLDVVALQQSLNAIVERHAVLRTSFAQVADQLTQQIALVAHVPLPMTDLRDLPSSAREAAARRAAQAEALRPFDLVQGPPLRAALLRLHDADHVLVLAFHHIVFDAWSIGVLYRELRTCYTAFRLGQRPELPALTIQYADYAHWQRTWLQGSIVETQLAYWRHQLADLPVLALPTDQSRPAQQTYHGALESLTLPAALTEGLRALNRVEGVTLFMTLLGAWQVVLARYSGQDDIAVGTPIAGRTRGEIEPLIGFFVNLLVLRADLSGQQSFRELLHRIRVTTLEAYAHQDLPFERLVEELQPERDMSRAPLVQVVFTIQHGTAQQPSLPELDITPIALEQVTAKYDLTLVVEEGDAELGLLLEYNTDLFQPALVRRMLGSMAQLLEAVVADPGQPLATLPLLSPSEQQRLLVDWNATATDYPRAATIQQLFEAQVTQTPTAIALVDGALSLSYAELNTRANQLAHYLRTLGVGVETPVGLYMERSAELIVALLGILKAGGMYVPLDLAYPAERLQFMLEDARVQLLLTERSLRASLTVSSAQVVALDEARPTIERMADVNPRCRVDADHLAYVCYTSGSTGTPKGVSVVQRAVVRLVRATEYVQLGPADHVAQVSNTSFDATTFEVWGALLNGARLVVVPREVALQPEAFVALLRAEAISAVFMTTAWFNQIVSLMPDALRSLRHVLFGGEACDPQRVRAVLAHGAPSRLLHVYGPTESTTFATWHLVDAVPDDALTVPIGRPLANTTAYILDRWLQPVPLGAVGELYLGGAGLARDYLNRPAQTAARFVPDPWGATPGARLYRTGDLVRYRADGAIEFLGRVDRQIKLRGFRIELHEIEAALTRHPQVHSAIVTLHVDANGNKQLVAYVAAGGTAALDGLSDRQLHAWLSDQLPEYMIPALFVLLESLPLTANGKIDRDALPTPEQARLSTAHERVAPRTPVEEVLAAIWADVLDVPEVGIHDDFFALGGHSLLVTQLIAQIRTLFQIELPLRAVFEATTVEQLALELVAREPRPGHLARVSAFLQQMLSTAEDVA